MWGPSRISGSSPWLRVALALLGALAPAVAGAQAVESELEVGGGYDSNPRLAADPGNRRAPDSRDPGASGDGLFAARGFVEGELGDELTLGARLDVDARVYGSGDALAWERLRVDAGLRLAPVVAICGLGGERLDAGLVDDAAWTLVGRCGARVELPEGFWLGAELEVGGRFFDVGQTDVLAGGGGRVGWRLAPVQVELGLRALRRESDANQAQRTDLSPWARVRVSTELVGGVLDYRLLARQFDQGAQDGIEHVGRLEVWGMPLPWLGGFVELELGHAEGSSQALAYERVQLIGGARLVFGARAAPSAPSEPATVAGGRARFRFHLPGAERVSVIGEHNGWDGEAGRLVETAPGVFEGAVELEPGRYAYTLLVDGAPRTPPGVARTTDDGFGGRNAVLIVEP